MRPPVLHIIPFLWSGAGAVVTQLCEDQRRDGPVTLVSTSRHDTLADWPSYRRRLRRAGITHYTIDFFHRDATAFWRSTSALADVIREVRPAVIHAHAGVPSCGAVMARAIAARRARLIAQMYSWGTDRAEWMNVQDTWGFGQSDRIICSSRDYCDRLVEYGVPRRKLTYLPWGLPLDRLRMRAQADRETVRPAIGFVGRIEPRKGQRELVDAFAQVRKTWPRARLDLVGPIADAAYAAEVTARIQHHGLADAVRMPGEVDDATAWARTWDLFVSLSSDEGQGLAVLEAMAVGVPVAARLVPGIADFLIDGRNGLAIRGSAISTAARVMRRALARPALRRDVARRARRLVERRYSWVQTLRAFDRLYWS